MTATHCTCSQSWTERHAPGCLLGPYPRPADFDRMTDAEFWAYCDRIGFTPLLADPLYVAEPEHVTERADRIAERILVAVLVLVAVAYVAVRVWR